MNSYRLLLCLLCFSLFLHTSQTVDIPQSPPPSPSPSSSSPCSAATCEDCLLANYNITFNNTTPVCHWCASSQIGFCSRAKDYDPLTCQAYVVDSRDCPAPPPISSWTEMLSTLTIIVFMGIVLCCACYGFSNCYSRACLGSCQRRRRIHAINAASVSINVASASINSEENAAPVIIFPPDVPNYGSTDKDEKETESSAKNLTCGICFEKEKNVVLNCGHTLCLECAKQISVCPYCKTRIKEIKRIYL